MRRTTGFILAIDALLVMATVLGILAWAVIDHIGLPVYEPLLRAAIVETVSDGSVRLGIVVAAGALFLLHLIWFYRVMRGRSHRGAIVIQKDDGSLVIAVSAIEDSLERAVKRQSGVKDVRIQARVSPDPALPTEVVVVASILDSDGIHAVEERMRQAVRRRFQEILPQQEPRISVRLRRFLAEDSPKSKRDEVERVYRGPEYPVEGF